MKAIILGALLLAAGWASAQAPGGGANSAGIIIGDPTGLSFKHWLSATRAFDVAAAWSLDHDETLHVHADYLIHDFSLREDRGELGWYYGVGARFVARDHHDSGRGRSNDDDDTFGARIPFGLDYFFADHPIEVFLEVAPALELVPDTDLDLDLGLGLRFVFR